MSDCDKQHLTAEAEVNERKFYHCRSHTGVVSSSVPNWTDDELATAIWEKCHVNAVESNDVKSVQQSFVRHVVTTLARTHFNMDNHAAYQAISYAIRDRLIEKWNATQQHHTKMDVKRVYYLSLEFLLGRSLDNALLNMGVKGNYGEAMRQLGFVMEDLIDEEKDAALGNGGLGRLAACFMDSLATVNLPAWGYGLRYTYGIFEQKIRDGFQTEFPDYWLTFGNPWEIPRLDVYYEVRFYGSVTKTTDPATGQVHHAWVGGESVQAVAYDVPIPGYQGASTINIRLWSSKPTKKFDLQSFNEGNYQASVAEQQKAENITSVLYPNDNTMAGKELRLKQQYFFVCATLKDIIRRFKKVKRPWSDFPAHVAIQLNDTHPALGIAELQRLLVDVEGLAWDAAWQIVTQVYSFTNHTVLPEAQEKWPVAMLSALLPRHMAIIYDINLFFLQKVEAAFPDDLDRLARMSIIEEGPQQQVRMAHLAVVGSHTVNGVAEIHSNLIKATIFKDFVEFYGGKKFQNKTNGITPRRWLLQANPDLAALISQKLGSDTWLTNLDLLKFLRSYADDAEFQQRWMDIKRANKVRLAHLIKDVAGVEVSPDALFDVQVKRFHEYKRQFMNILGIIHRYNVLKGLNDDQLKRVSPRVFIFAGKAAPGYFIAKLVIKLINSVAAVVNQDTRTSKFLKVVFIPDYNVSNAEKIIPASDISEHISTAGTEASGTSNMKFALNGGLIIGTLDGANVEIKQEIGDENIFIFGCKAHEVPAIRHAQKYRKVDMNGKLKAVLESLQAGRFCPYDVVAPLVETLTTGGDFYLISHDFESYLQAQDHIDKEFQNKSGWAKKSILSTAGMGKFSSDRSIMEYARDIWHLEPCLIPQV